MKGVVIITQGIIYLICVTLTITHLTGLNATNILFWLIYIPLAILNIFEKTST